MFFTSNRVDTRVVPNINAGNWNSPSWISRDHCRLYVTSDRFGSYDILVASRER